MLKQLLKQTFRQVARERAYAEDIINSNTSKDYIAATLSLTQDQIYGSIYPEVQELFKEAVKNKRLRREQILWIKAYLNDVLMPYKQYYNQRYANDISECYTLLRSPFLSNVEYTKISVFILECIKIY